MYCALWSCGVCVWLMHVVCGLCLYGVCARACVCAYVWVCMYVRCFLCYVVMVVVLAHIY